MATSMSLSMLLLWGYVQVNIKLLEFEVVSPPDTVLD
jgi:hypothetical protein